MIFEMFTRIMFFYKQQFLWLHSQIFEKLKQQDK